MEKSGFHNINTKKIQMINFESEEAEAIYITTLGNECEVWLQKPDKSFNNIEVNNLITRIKEYLMKRMLTNI